VQAHDAGLDRDSSRAVARLVEYTRIGANGFVWLEMIWRPAAALIVIAGVLMLAACAGLEQGGAVTAGSARSAAGPGETTDAALDLADRRRDLDHARGGAVAPELADPPGAGADGLIGRIREDEMTVDQADGIEAERLSVQADAAPQGAVRGEPVVIDRFGAEETRDREARHGSGV
jgi:hypothetical protein